MNEPTRKDIARALLRVLDTRREWRRNMGSGTQERAECGRDWNAHSDACIAATDLLAKLPELHELLSEAAKEGA